MTRQEAIQVLKKEFKALQKYDKKYFKYLPKDLIAAINEAKTILQEEIKREKKERQTIIYEDAIAATDAVATQFMPTTKDDPIKKGLEWWVDFSLETFVTLKGYDKNTNEEVINTKYEFDKEEELEIELKANTTYQAYIWSTAYIDYYYGFGGIHRKKEYMTKTMYYQIKTSSKGELSLELISEKVAEASSPDVIEKYSVELASQPKPSAHLIYLKGSATTPEKDEDGVKYEKKVVSETETNLRFTIDQESIIIPQPISKKLIFESENQAILSCNELRTLHRWWEELSPNLKKKIKDKTAEIEIVGYTTTTGTDRYNDKLGLERALDVRNALTKIIGIDAENKSIAVISCSTKGELSDEPSRYVKLIVINI